MASVRILSKLQVRTLKGVLALVPLFLFPQSPAKFVRLIALKYQTRTVDCPAATPTHTDHRTETILKNPPKGENLKYSVIRTTTD